MATVSDGYTTLVDLKEALSLSGETYADNDIARAINAASRAIDNYCGRLPGAFNQDGSDSTRQYTPVGPEKVRVDDLSSITTLKTDDDGDRTFEITWSSSDYLLKPVNAAADSHPYTEIVTTANGSHDFPAYQASVEVTGTFGWPATPAVVEEACMLQATRFMKRVREAPFGVAGVNFEGEGIRLMNRLDADVEMMIKPLRRIAPPRTV